MTVEYLTRYGLHTLRTGRVSIGSVTSRYGSLESALLGVTEKIGYGGARTSGIGFDKPFQHRLESRPAGADAVVHAAAASELGSMFEAVQKHVHPYKAGEKLSALADRLVDTGERKLIVDAHYKPFDSIPLATNHAVAGNRFAGSERLRRLLGDDFYLSTVAYTRPAEGIHTAKLSTHQQANLFELQREADAHVERIGVEQHETTDITRKIREVMDKMEPPTPGPNWKERVVNDVKGRLGLH